MATKRKQAAPADGASTAAGLKAAWPFPRKPKGAGKTNSEEDDAVDPAREREDFHADFDAHADATHPATPDRIHVDAINLYTDLSQNVVERIALEQLIESPTNARTHYDATALDELADTIRGVGVMQPLLARPIDYANIMCNDQRVQAYEIVFGHRRYRAAKIACCADVPVIVRKLTDAQSAQLQAIENVQRQDLDALEEAQAYANYIQAHGVSKDQLAAEIGLSRTNQPESRPCSPLNIATTCTCTCRKAVPAS